MRKAEYETMFHVEETHWWYATLHELLFATLDKEMPAWRSKRILDAGCGTGAILQRLGNPEMHCGVDLSPDAIAFCHQRGLKNAQQADICALPFADSSFDAVICSSVLYHEWVPKVDVALLELRRVMQPGGLFLINLPAYGFLHSAHDEAVMTARRFTKSEVKSLLNKNGFAIARLTYWTTLAFPLAVVARTLGMSRSGRDFESSGNTWTDRVMAAMARFEVTILKIFSLPFGVALFGVARKPSGGF